MMTQKKYRPFHSVIQKIAASQPGAWFFARTLHQFDRIFLRLSGGRMTLSSFLSGLPLVIVTSTGAKSGLPRIIPLLCIRDQITPSNFAIIATNWGQKHYPAWYFNLKSNPQATCSIAGEFGEYIAHEAAGDEYARFWQYAADTYIGYPQYKQRISGRHIPIMVMTPLKS